MNRKLSFTNNNNEIPPNSRPPVPPVPLSYQTANLNAEPLISECAQKTKSSLTNMAIHNKSNNGTDRRVIDEIEITKSISLSKASDTASIISSISSTHNNNSINNSSSDLTTTTTTDSMLSSKRPAPIIITNAPQHTNEKSKSLPRPPSLKNLRKEGTATISGFLKTTFKPKKQPEMITDTTYQSMMSSDSQSLDGDSLPVSPAYSTSPQHDDNNITGAIYNVFGIPLEEAIKLNVPFEEVDILTKSDSLDQQICDIEYQKYVPLIVLKLTKFILKYGLHEEGLYRISGSSNDVKQLKRRFIMGEYFFHCTFFTSRFFPLVLSFFW